MGDALVLFSAPELVMTVSVVLGALLVGGGEYGTNPVHGYVSAVSGSSNPYNRSIFWYEA